MVKEDGRERWWGGGMGGFEGVGGTLCIPRAYLEPN